MLTQGPVEFVRPTQSLALSGLVGAVGARENMDQGGRN
jgi:hypothetical protein